MYLFKTDGSFKLEFHEPSSLWNDASKKYGILSHTWARINSEEVSFEDMKDLEAARKKPGFSKLEMSCKKAAWDKLQYVWIDTCCIDKSGPHDQIQSEINSMFQYYAHAEVCYVLLSDVPGSCPQIREEKTLQEVFTKSRRTWQQHIMGSRWFTRGWTLQELIAPKKVAFYNRRWAWIGTMRSGLLDTVSKATQIPKDVLMKKGAHSLEDYTIAQRMAWAANRQTTKPEDMAYCLLGIFNRYVCNPITQSFLTNA